MSEFINFAKDLAYEAGSVMRQRRREGDLKVVYKPDGSPVTMVDTEINDLIIERIISEYDGHAIIGEEASYGSEASSDVWVVDPP